VSLVDVYQRESCKLELIYNRKQTNIWTTHSHYFERYVHFRTSHRKLCSKLNGVCVYNNLNDGPYLKNDYVMYDMYNIKYNFEYNLDLVKSLISLLHTMGLQYSPGSCDNCSIITMLSNT